MHAMFQRHWPNNYLVTVLFTQLKSLRFPRGTCIRVHTHAAEIVQYLEEGMQLSYKKTVSEWV